RQPPHQPVELLDLGPGPVRGQLGEDRLLPAVRGAQQRGALVGDDQDAAPGVPGGGGLAQVAVPLRSGDEPAGAGLVDAELIGDGVHRGAALLLPGEDGLGDHDVPAVLRVGAGDPPGPVPDEPEERTAGAGGGRVRGHPAPPSRPRSGRPRRPGRAGGPNTAVAQGGPVRAAARPVCGPHLRAAAETPGPGRWSTRPGASRAGVRRPPDGPAPPGREEQAERPAPAGSGADARCPVLRPGPGRPQHRGRSAGPGRVSSPGRQGGAPRGPRPRTAAKTVFSERGPARRGRSGSGAYPPPDGAAPFGEEGPTGPGTARTACSRPPDGRTGPPGPVPSGTRMGRSPAPAKGTYALRIGS